MPIVFPRGETLNIEYPAGMSEADYIWAALILAGAAYEVHTLRNRRNLDTLSETTRRWFQVRTPVGRAVFALGWVGFSVWFLLHVLEPWK